MQSESDNGRKKDNSASFYEDSPHGSKSTSLKGVPDVSQELEDMYQLDQKAEEQVDAGFFTVSNLEPILAAARDAASEISPDTSLTGSNQKDMN